MRNADLFRGALELPDDDRYDAHDSETPEPCRGCGGAYCDSRCGVFDTEAVPCRGCGSIHCDSECAEFRAWLTVAWLEADTADRASQAAYIHRWGDADARP